MSDVVREVAEYHADGSDRCRTDVTTYSKKHASTPDWWFWLGRRGRVIGDRLGEPDVGLDDLMMLFCFSLPVVIPAVWGATMGWWPLMLIPAMVVAAVVIGLSSRSVAADTETIGLSGSAFVSLSGSAQDGVMSLSRDRLVLVKWRWVEELLADDRTRSSTEELLGLVTATSNRSTPELVSRGIDSLHHKLVERRTMELAAAPDFADDIAAIVERT